MNPDISWNGCGMDCLKRDMKRERIETKARIIAGIPITDEEILNEALDRHFKGIMDPGPLTD